MCFESNRKRKFPVKDRKKAKEKKKFPIKDWKKTKENIQKGLQTRQFLNNVQDCHKQEIKERKPWLATHEAVPCLITN